MNTTTDKPAPGTDLSTPQPHGRHHAHEYTLESQVGNWFCWCGQQDNSTELPPLERFARTRRLTSLH